MNSNTVPVPRMDKNGRIVTRHMKVDQNSGSPSLGNAAPPMSNYVDDYLANFEVVRDAIDSAIDTGAYDDIDDVDFSALDRKLKNLQPHTIAAYRNQIDETPDRGYEDLLISVLVNGWNSDKAGWVLHVTQQTCADGDLQNEWDDDIRGTYQYEKSIQIMYGTEKFFAGQGTPAPRDILLESDPQELEKIDGLVKTIGGCIDKGLEYYFDSAMADSTIDDDLGQIAVEHPKRTKLIIETLANHSADLDDLEGILQMDTEEDDDDRILSIMRERNTVDPETIEVVLKAEAKSLSSGVL